MTDSIGSNRDLHIFPCIGNFHSVLLSVLPAVPLSRTRAHCGQSLVVLRPFLFNEAMKLHQTPTPTVASWALLFVRLAGHQTKMEMKEQGISTHNVE